MKITINGKEYTTFEDGTIKELGIDPTRKFIVCSGGIFNVGDVVVLERDDNTAAPYFRRLSDIAIEAKYLSNLAYYDEHKIIKELDGIKVGDKVEYEYKGKKYYGYVAVLYPHQSSSCLLRLKGFNGHSGGCGCNWNEDWYPESEKKDESNCYWANKSQFKVVNENLGSHCGEMIPWKDHNLNITSGSQHTITTYCIAKHLTNLNKPTGNKFMSNVIKFAKELVLSKEEKLLRKYGLKDECGEYSDTAKELVLDKLVKENEAYLIDIAQKMSEEEE